MNLNLWLMSLGFDGASDNSLSFQELYARLHGQSKQLDETQMHDKGFALWRTSLGIQTDTPNDVEMTAHEVFKRQHPADGNYDDWLNEMGLDRILVEKLSLEDLYTRQVSEQVFVEVEGGCVQSVFSTAPHCSNIQVFINDEDSIKEGDDPMYVHREDTPKRYLF